MLTNIQWQFHSNNQVVIWRLSRTHLIHIHQLPTRTHNTSKQVKCKHRSDTPTKHCSKQAKVKRKGPDTTLTYIHEPCINQPWDLLTVSQSLVWVVNVISKGASVQVIKSQYSAHNKRNKFGTNQFISLSYMLRVLQDHLQYEHLILVGTTKAVKQ